jgi:hypothetical protein
LLVVADLNALFDFLNLAVKVHEQEFDFQLGIFCVDLPAQLFEILGVNRGLLGTVLTKSSPRIVLYAPQSRWSNAITLSIL